MRSPDHRARLALLLALGGGLFALCGCGSNSAGDVRLRSASMVDMDQDMRMNYDTASSIRWAPP